MMLRFVLVVILLPTLLGAAVSDSWARGRRTPPPACVPAGAHVLLADRSAAVYTIHAQHIFGDRSVEAVIQTRACVGARRRSHEIWEEPAVWGLTEIGGGIANLCLSGTVVAYEESFNEATRYTIGQEVREEWHVIVRDLRTERVLHRVPTGAAGPAHPKFVGDGGTAAIVVKSDGAVAWVLETVDVPDRYEVRALDRTGERVLATGSNIAPYSLSLSGRTIHWRQGGKLASSPLS
jgi:hypothetical protein